MTTPDRYQQIKRIFLGACDLDPGEQENYLAEACGDDDDLRAEVERLFAEQTEHGTEALKPSLPDSMTDEIAQKLIGQTIGRYRITRVIDSGGMGTVYEAMQNVPERPVAVKVIKPGIASEEMLRRFEHEAQVLGRLHHPGIAQIYEAGTFDLGSGRQPFFAMELIEGKSLCDHFSDAELGTRQRLELMSKVCHAVQHAHQKGVIHRDLKPGNIMVDQWGQPKVLDFGVARTIDADIRTTSLGTGLDRFIGTVAYMSPEQAGGDPDQIDVRSDVYALGVICYEILAGRLPYEIDRKMIHEAARVIREEDPTPLSSINRTLRGDLETIITKALEKAKDRRYQSVAEFAADIERYLRNEPIVARPPSTWYQARKFAQRNRALVTGAAAVVGVLIAGIIVSTAMYAQAEAARQETAEERDRALHAEAMAEEQRRIAEENEQRAVREAERALAAEAEAEQRAEELELVAEFQQSQLAEIETELMGIDIRRDILDRRRDFMAGRGMDEEAIKAALAELEQSLTGVNFTDIALKTLDKNIFERALAAIDEQFADQPLIQARLLQTVADTLRTIGLLDRATQPQTEALDIRRRVLGDEHPQTLVSIQGMGALLVNQGAFAEAEVYLVEAIRTRRRVLGESHPRTLHSINTMGGLLFRQGRYNEAEPYHAEAIEGFRLTLGEDHPRTLSAINMMGGLLAQQGRYADAEPYLRESMEARRRILGDEHPETLNSIHDLCALLASLNNLAEAEPYCREALDARRRIRGETHFDTLNSLMNMSMLLMRLRRVAEAETYAREGMETARRVLGDEHPSTLESINSLGVVLAQQGKLAEAEPYFHEAVESRRRILGAAHPNTLRSISMISVLLQMQGQLAEAKPYYREILETRRQALGNDHPHTLQSISNLGSLLGELGQLEEAERLGAEAVETARRVLPEGHWHKAVYLVEHAWILRRMDRFAEAEERMLEAHAIFESALGPEHYRTINTIGVLADFYDAWHEHDPDSKRDMKAAEWRAKLPTVDDDIAQADAKGADSH